MDVQQILKEINDLSLKDRMKIYNYLGIKLKQVEHLKSVLDKLKGRGKNILGIEPQEYINKIREDDRV